MSQPLAYDIQQLDESLGSVLAQIGAGELQEVARRLFHDHSNYDPKATLQNYPELNDPAFTAKLLRAFTILFQLINTAEQKEIIRVNRNRTSKSSDVVRAESIEDAIASLRDQGMSADQVQDLLLRLEIIPTLTAHPTEARRRAVLDKLYSVAKWLVELSMPQGLTRIDTNLSSHEILERELEKSLLELWQTEEIRNYKLTVANEARNTLYFFENCIIDVVTTLHRDLRSALNRYYPGIDFEIPPFIQYGSWVGGDRDGNPNVTPELSWQTMLSHKILILEFYIRRVKSLQKEFTLSSGITKPSDELVESLERDIENVPISQDWLSRYQQEPYALKLRFIGEKLIATLRQTQTLVNNPDWRNSLPLTPPAYENTAEFLQDVNTMQRSLTSSGLRQLAQFGSLANLAVQIETFGFHMATLDIRQHSDEHQKEMDQIVRMSKVDTGGRLYSELEEHEKVTLLTREILNPRPLLDWTDTGNIATYKILSVFHVIKKAQTSISEKSVYTYIISMTHGLSDILEALLFAKESGLIRWTLDSEGNLSLQSYVDIVPLFETIDDLNRSDGLMKAAFDNVAYKLHLQSRKQTQEIMLGYSDSSKDGGYLAANWALQNTQATLAAVCHAHNVSMRLFHGRGGTVGRGGGRANRAILSQPAGSFDGKIRFTEQGEVISFRYSLLPIAHRHLEQIVSAAILASKGVQKTQGEIDRWRRAMTLLSERSRQVYRGLIYDDPDFWTFYSTVTPIMHISRLPIASRPTFRPGKGPSTIEGLRAIPWVFAWVQSRYVLPGWYGIGSALQWYVEQDVANIGLLQDMYKNWSFFRTVLDAAQLELLRANLDTAAQYANAAGNQRVAQHVHKIIEAEHKLTVAMILRVTNIETLLAHAPVVRSTVEFRNPIVAPMNRLQVMLMHQWNLQSDQTADGDPALKQALLLSIAGLAAAMQSTG